MKRKIYLLYKQHTNVSWDTHYEPLLYKMYGVACILRNSRNCKMLCAYPSNHCNHRNQTEWNEPKSIISISQLYKQSSTTECLCVLLFLFLYFLLQKNRKFFIKPQKQEPFWTIWKTKITSLIHLLLMFPFQYPWEFIKNERKSK